MAKVPNHVFLKNSSEYVTLQEVIDTLNERLAEYYQTHYPNLCKDGPCQQLEVEPGRKFFKLVTVDRPMSDSFKSSPSRSVYCFIDMVGNIYKAATWKAPAKHIRGSIFDPDFSWGKALDSYGAAYLR